MNNRRLNKIILIFILPVFLSGCWDYIEVEKRSYVIGIGVDKSEDKYKDKNSVKYVELETAGPLYDFTIEIPLLAAGQHTPQGQGGGGDKPKDAELTATSNAFFEAHRYFSTTVQSPPNYSHLYAIVIGEDVAREGMKNHMDIFLRDPELRRRAQVYITPDKAKKILGVVPDINNYAGVYLVNLSKNIKRTSRVVNQRDLGYISKAMYSGKDYVLPRVVSEGNRIKNAGAAVFKDNKMVGWIDEIKMSYLNWITGEIESGAVSINMTKSKDEVVVLQLVKEKTKRKPIIDGDSIAMSLDIKANMNIQEISSEKVYEADNPAFLAELENLAEEHIKKEIKETIKYIQNDYGADVFQFSDAMKRQEPKAWAKVEKKWDDIIKNMDIYINVDVKINHYGLIK